jgi:DNA-binding response OmpR family regulator
MAPETPEPVAGAPAPVVVLIEDEPQIRRFLRATLGSQGYPLHEATTGEDGLIEAASRQPDVVILDLGLPDLDGLTVIRRLREWSRVPIIVLSARGQERDKVAALDAGADDYVSKPFAVGELPAGLPVALRHAAVGESGEPPFTVGGLLWTRSSARCSWTAGTSTSPRSSTACSRPWCATPGGS